MVQHKSETGAYFVKVDSPTGILVFGGRRYRYIHRRDQHRRKKECDGIEHKRGLRPNPGDQPSRQGRADNLNQLLARPGHRVGREHLIPAD